jgi:hypothetical protein
MLPLWHWLLALACGLVLCDVAVRRLAVEPAQVAAKVRNLWARLRGQAVAEPTHAEFMDRLQARWAEPGSRSARRFEGGPGGLAPTGADAAAAPPPPAGPRPAGQPSAPGQPEPEGGGLDQLLKAKKRVWEERNQDGGNG